MSKSNSNVTAELGAINSLWQDADKAQKESSRLAQEAWDRTGKLATQIQTGEASTGNPLKDYVIVAHQSVRDESVQKLMALESKFPEHQGEFVLVVTAEEFSTRHVGIGYDRGDSPHDFDVRELFYLAVIMGECFTVDLNRQACNFPTASFFAKWHNGKQETTEDALSFSRLTDINIQRLDQELKCKNSVNEYRETDFVNKQPIGYTRYKELEILIGDEAVENWFLQQSPKYRQIYHRLGVLLCRNRYLPEIVKAEAGELA